MIIKYQVKWGGHLTGTILCPTLTGIHLLSQ